MTEIRGRDGFAGIRYDEKTNEVLVRCTSCNIYKRGEDFASSLFSVCERCQDIKKHAQDNRPTGIGNSTNIYDYLEIGNRRQLEQTLWRFLKDTVVAKKRQPRKPGRPSTSKAKQRMVREVLDTERRAVPKKYRVPIMQLIANNALPPIQLMWLALRPELLPKKILRLSAIDTAREVARSGDLQNICDIGYFYDDAESASRFPDSAVASLKAQKDLRLRVAGIAKELGKHRVVPKSTWDAYEALLAAVHPGPGKAAESTAYYYMQVQMHIWQWSIERSLRKLLKIYTKHIEAHAGIACEAEKAALLSQRTDNINIKADADNINIKADDINAIKRYWVSCSSIYPSDRYLAEVGSDKDTISVIVFHNPSNSLEIGRRFTIPRDKLEPSEDGYIELFEDELKTQGVKLP